LYLDVIIHKIEVVGRAGLSADRREYSQSTASVVLRLWISWHIPRRSGQLL